MIPSSPDVALGQKNFESRFPTSETTYVRSAEDRLIPG